MARRLAAVLLPLAVLAACGDKDGEETGTVHDGGGDDTGLEGVDADGDGYGADSDCDDTSSAVHPGADEVCDGVDNDCDEEIDEDPVDGETFWVDADQDGYGDPAQPIVSCAVAEVWAENDLDCDDGDAAIHPGAAEVCDGVDNDCDGLVDDADDSVDPTTYAPWWRDGDGDGYGDPAIEPLLACADPSDEGGAWVDNGDDCDDALAAVSPAATEVCDDADTDEDCDGLVDDADDSVDLAGASSWYADADADGYGDAATADVACDDPSDGAMAWVADATDCDDTAAGTHPGATEVCDDADTDEDCDGAADDLDASVDPATLTVWHADQDGDGYGAPDLTATGCDAPVGGGRTWVVDSADCDDTDAAVNPGAAEVCDAADTDEDCSGAADDADTGVDPSTHATWYTDADTDGYGDTSTATQSCDPASGQVSDATDCDDTDAAVNPGAAEVCDDADTDEDCSGVADDADTGVDVSTYVDWTVDADGDGYGDQTATAVRQCEDPSTLGTTYVADATDCDDGDADISPAGQEVCDAGDTDEDCDGLVDDADSSVDPSSASEWYVDADLDGYGDSSATPAAACADPSGATTTYVADGTDCDDADADINPGATEWYGDGIDQTCDGSDTPTFSCSGWSVPGDYSSISAASAALGNSTSVQTICLSARTYTENPTIRGNLEIIGPSAYDTTINGHVTVVSSRSSATVLLQGVTVTNGIEVDGGGSASWTTTISDCILEETSYDNLLVNRDGYATPSTILQRSIVEVKFGSAGAYLYDYGYNTTDRVTFSVKDNYFTSSTLGSYGIRTAITKSSSRRPLQSVTITGNTIEGQNYGLWLIGRGTSPNRVLNNVFTGNATAYHWDGSGSLTSDYNLYYGNSTSFSGSAAGGAHRVTTDPGLSADVPPVPAAGGSADQAGTTSYASSTDFWTNPRPSPPSIGAVEP